ncbi:TPA: zf-HC2 domain-containing protein [Mannheimia haemolytica]|uniref:Zf-HC2 domain-containing protein n=1 Tax=Mannheimia haemolytica TaxID=75985 RepID=A0A378N7A9_MANHA|nr:zf-HC2 domain-containing protein [Mannheimia haemolytica]AGK02858.1 putative zinc-finger protein [Mannheimia haemolytica M42548]AGQ24965.1 dsDNA-mimic protein [Mannheimia haemolytica D153]AGQ40532.1 dsDNA-mimic protein [Mannheimia haemolytica D174]AGR75418.1 dsDNA-mimic protein [Mannheimia haemolytica USMARC_2286]EDN73278.1 hypothetical protein MHA_0295 [Mannheimia haemolytica PHL213]
MLKCKQITELVSLSQEQKLTLKQRVNVQVHLMLCSRCRAFSQNCKTVDKLMKEFNS